VPCEPYDLVASPLGSWCIKSGSGEVTVDSNVLVVGGGRWEKDSSRISGGGGIECI
jgi:hypothetical protein